MPKESYGERKGGNRRQQNFVVPKIVTIFVTGKYCTSSKRMKLKTLIISMAISASAITAGAVTLDEAKKLYLEGDFEQALPAFQKALKAKPKDGSLNHWTGVCLYRTGHPEKAIPYLKKAQERKVLESPRFLAEIALDAYEFDEARDYLDEYYEAMKRNKRTPSPEVEEIERRISIARPMMDGVQKIIVIDSMTVAKTDFFRAYRLAPEAGTLNGREQLPAGVGAADETVVYIPESGELMIWAAPDKNDNFELVQSAKMVGGKWERPHALGDNLNFNGGDSNYPFLLSDGITLYYANNGEASLGGYDIFMTRQNDDGTYLTPQNIGMPYNSPYDDYMLAIDEMTGVGWWATDRNQIEDSVTIYRFIPQELRVNYPSDDPTLTDKARLTSYRATWPAGADYSALLESIEQISPKSTIKTQDFAFAMPGGKTYRYWDDFNSAHARDLMLEYLDMQSQFNLDKKKLALLRKRYHDGDTRVSDDILTLEAQILDSRKALQAKSNEVITAEVNSY